MSNKLQGWLAPNTLTEDPNDRFLVLNSAGTVDNEQLYKDMREEDTGLRIESNPLRTHCGTRPDERS